MQICWCTIKVQPNTLVILKISFKNYFYFLKFSTKDYDIVKFAHTFYFNDECQTVSRQQLICLVIHFCINSTKDRVGPKRKSNLYLIENMSANTVDSDLWKSDEIRWIRNRIQNPSHTQNWSFCLLSEGAVGVVVEYRTCSPHVQRLVRKCLLAKQSTLSDVVVDVGRCESLCQRSACSCTGVLPPQQVS